MRKLGRRSGTGQLAGSNFVLDALVEGETVAEVLENAQHQVRGCCRSGGPVKDRSS